MPMTRGSVARYLDEGLMAAASVALLVVSALAAHNLRDFTSSLTVVCVVLLAWRGISTLPDLSRLARALVTVLAVNLTGGAVATVLLSHGPAPKQGPLPANTTGLWLVIACRCLVLVLVIGWPWWLNEWGHPLSRPRPSEAPPRA